MPSKQDTLEILSRGRLALNGQFTFGSNYTFLVTASHKRRQLKVVYKPNKGGIPLYDFPADSLAARETAAYILSEALGWNLVPVTVTRLQAPYGPGSLQEFIPHNPEDTYFSLNEADRARLRPVVLFDLLLNNADRKGSHILRDKADNFRLIDHGLCFHIDPKLRTVIWDFSGQEIPENLLADIRVLPDQLAESRSLFAQLSVLLQIDEIIALTRRVQALLAAPVFPQPDSERRPFPWPLV